MGVGRVFKRGKIWHYAWHVRGREFSRTSRSESEAVANKLLRKAIEKSASGYLPTEDKVTFEDLMRKVENAVIG